jgi:hypothetical protein
MEDVFIEGTEPQEFCPIHSGTDEASAHLYGIEKEFQIAFPRDNDIFKLDPVLRRPFQKIKLKTNVPAGMAVDSVEWWVDDRKIGTASFPFSLFWDMKPGVHRIVAVALTGQNERMKSSVTIKVEE